MAIDQIKVGTYQNFAYMVYDIETMSAVMVDPAWDVNRLLGIMKSRNLNLDLIINTHSHFDHIEGNLALSNATGARIIMNEHSLAKKDKGVMDGEVLRIGKNIELEFVHTPGHSPESMCIIVSKTGILTGDTLFIGECGRVDLPGGSAEELFESFEKLRRIDPKLKVYPGHDYGSKPVSTLEMEFQSNYTLAKRTKEEFVKFMNEP